VTGVSPPPQGEIHVWTLEATARPFEEADAFLSPDERERARRFRFEADRRRFAWTRAGVRRILQRSYGVAASDLRFAASPRGKLHLLDHALEFNMSHGGDLAVVVVGASPVGVDVEPLRPTAPALPGRVLSPEELRVFKGALAPHVFLGCWTRKEALLKAKGWGVGADLRAISILPSAEGAGRFDVCGEPEWVVLEVPMPDGYVSAVAAERQRPATVRLEMKVEVPRRSGPAGHLTGPPDGD
jgi:4'-phosphopantetheinyl transferase